MPRKAKVQEEKLELRYVAALPGGKLLGSRIRSCTTSAALMQIHPAARLR